MATLPMSPQMVQAYKDATDNLIYLKKEQMQINYYTVAALAALYILSYSQYSTANLKAFFIVCSIALTIFSIYVIWDYQVSMIKFRTRLSYLYDQYFTVDERTGMRLEAVANENPALQFTPWLFSLVCFVAGCINLFLLS